MVIIHKQTTQLNKDKNRKFVYICERLNKYDRSFVIALPLNTVDNALWGWQFERCMNKSLLRISDFLNERYITKPRR